VSEQETRQKNFRTARSKDLLNIVSAAGAEKCLKALVAASRETVASSACVFLPPQKIGRL
jgi:hypothetical protein